MLPVHGEFTPFLLHASFLEFQEVAEQNMCLNQRRDCDGDMGGDVLVTDQHRRVEKKYLKGPPGRNRSP